MPVSNNFLGIRGTSHFSIPCEDVEVSLGFYEEILGAKLIPGYKLGFTEEEKRAGRAKHAFVEIGTQKVELVDAHGEFAPRTVHHAFDIGPHDVAIVEKHLKDKGIPFRGPLTHKGTESLSIYFRDPDKNRLELCCWDGYPGVQSFRTSQDDPNDRMYRWDPNTRRAIASND